MWHAWSCNKRLSEQSRMELRKTPLLPVLMLLLWWERSITIFTTHLILRTGIGGSATVLCARAAFVLQEAALRLPRTFYPHHRTDHQTSSGVHLNPDGAHNNPTENSSSPPGPASEIMSRHDDHHYSSTGRHEDRRDEDYDRRQHDHHGSRSSRTNDEHRRVTYFTFPKNPINQVFQGEKF